MKINFYFHLILSVIVLGSLLNSCSCSKESKAKGFKINSAFKSYIEGFTCGYISTTSEIIVRVNFDFADSTIFNKPFKENLFSFEPSIEGTTMWLDSRTVAFKPKQRLPFGKYYEVKFYLNKIFNVPDSMKIFKFYFNTINQNFDIQIENLRAYSESDYSSMFLTGVLYTADVENLENIKKILKAKHLNKEIRIKWGKAIENRKFNFTIDSIKQVSDTSIVEIFYDGEEINVDKTGNIKIKVPPLNEFYVTSVEVKQQPDPLIVVQFSNPLDKNQELEGKITIGKFSNYSYIIDFNQLLIYPTSTIYKDDLLMIDKSIKNSLGKSMNNDFSTTLPVKPILPDIRFISDGTIIPFSSQSKIDFEVINLKAVDIRILKIYENNIPQFLQVNELSGKYQLSRVAKIIKKETIVLGNVPDNNKWNRFSLDISKLVKTDPGAIYRIELSFKKEYVTIDCPEINTNSENILSEPEEEPYEDWMFYNEWGEYSLEDEYYDDYYGSYYGDYSFFAIKDLCSNLKYYKKSTSINILATDIGITAKIGEDQAITIFTSNISNSEPLSNINIDVLNFQLQKIASGSTDNDGKCILKISNKPFLVIAKKDKQQSYLKLSEENLLSFSNFDVSGEKIQKGLKGFIYTERGVWRPGDSIFVTFILEDNNKTVIDKHPVIFEVYNPLGNLVEKRTIFNNLNGFYYFPFATSYDAITGNYSLLVKVGNQIFDKTLKIETIKPNRLKIEFNTGDNKIISLNSLPYFEINSQRLHGTPAKNYKVSSEISFYKTTTKFSKFSDYIFDDISRKISSDKKTLFSGTLNENGYVKFNPDITINNAPGFVKANIESRVYEPGGEFSVDFVTITISPYLSYAGIKSPRNEKMPYLFTDSVNKFLVVNLNENGEPISASKLKVEVYKLGWDYWWGGYEELSDFIYSSSAKKIEDKEIEIVKGKGTFDLRINHSDWGRYFIKVIDIQSGHSCSIIEYFDWFGFNRNKNTNDKYAAAMLSLSTDKSTYNVGDDIKLYFKAPLNSRAYITIENGTKILNTYLLKENNGFIDFKLKATKEMLPNIYIFVYLLQPHSNTINGLPLRMYGVIPINIEDKNTKLNPVISCDEVLRPKSTATISVSELNGNPMTYTLAMVDEGLLNLTRFKTPNPYSTFFAREALGVKTWDAYNSVIGATNAPVLRTLSIGGGEELTVNPSTLKAVRFKPMVVFIGPYELKKGSKNVHKINIPNYVGSVRIMVVAGQDKKYGNAEKSIPVRKPLMILGSSPRVIGPGESFTLPVSIFALENTVKNVTVKVSVNDIFKINGSNVKSIAFSSTGEKLIKFNIDVKEQVGIGKINVIAESGKEKSEWSVELNVRAANPYTTFTKSFIINPGEKKQIDYTSIGYNGTNSNVLEISSFVPFNINKWLNYLLDYPHGCAEQTTSGSFPLLYADELSITERSVKAQIESKIKTALKRIQSMQVASGGIAMWPGSYYPDDWITSYAGHFVIEAQKKGYVVSNQFIKKWKNYQQTKCKNWRYNKNIYNNDLIQAYRLYTLALAGSPEIGEMNKLNECKYLSYQASTLLAASYAIIGRDDIAKNLLKRETSSVDNLSYNYIEDYYTYGSYMRDKAFILETLLSLNMKDRSLDIVKEIASILSSSDWLNTQTAGQLLRSVALFIKQYPPSYNLNFTFEHDKERKDYSTISTIHQINLGSKKSGKINVINNGKGTLYANLHQKGIPKTSEEKEFQNNLKMNITYTDIDGTEINVENLAQGKVFYANVTVYNTNTLKDFYSNMALTQIFPSGWEILSDRFTFDEKTQNTFTYQDIRDDRVMTYFDLTAKYPVNIKIRLCASYAGYYYLPSVYCEAMYDNRIKALKKGKWVKVYDEENLTYSEKKKK